MSSPVEHDRSARRFSTVVDGVEAELTYVMRGGALVIDHTGVPTEIGGRGVAGDLVKAALEYARAEGIKVVPACSYAAAFVQRHRDYDDVLAG